MFSRSANRASKQMMFLQGARTYVKHKRGPLHTHTHTLQHTETFRKWFKVYNCFDVLNKCSNTKAFHVLFSEDGERQSARRGHKYREHPLPPTTITPPLRVGAISLSKPLNWSLWCFHAHFEVYVWHCLRASSEGGLRSPVLHIPLFSQISLLLPCCAPARRLPGSLVSSKCPHQ